MLPQAAALLPVVVLELPSLLVTPELRQRGLVAAHSLLGPRPLFAEAEDLISLLGAWVVQRQLLLCHVVNTIGLCVLA